jgi:hypothetical protein
MWFAPRKPESKRWLLCGIDPAMRISKNVTKGEPLSAEFRKFPLFGAYRRHIIGRVLYSQRASTLSSLSGIRF